ncbi:MAG: GvpL/GvpF family gas vesicle protein [Methanobacterium sp.]|jgi:ribosomal protein L12E/L44/L45/RPP1/RPP2
MRYIYAALALHAAGKEINEKNLRKTFEAMDMQINEAELEALITLLRSLTQKTNTSQFKSLERRIEELEKSVVTINDKLVAISKATTTQTAENEAQIEEVEDEVFPEDAPAGVVSGNDGRYLYCVADSGEEMSLGDIGIENSEVYTIPYNDICAVVHNCPAEPYKSDDDEVVKSWIMKHEKVIETAWEKFGTVLPLGFDIIIKSDDDPKQTVKKWLNEDYENLKQQIEKVRGRAEYGIQILWDPKIIGHDIAESNEEIKKLKEEIRTKSKGAAYIYKQKIENKLKKEMEKKADRCFKEFYGRIKKRVGKIRVEKTKKDEKMQMLMNLSCLISNDKVEKLGVELDKINKMDGLFVRFTGPWPPYSFVGLG